MLHGPGFDSRWVQRILFSQKTETGGQPVSPQIGTGAIQAGKSSQGFALDTHPPI
jgi:hypothetical protein